MSSEAENKPFCDVPTDGTCISFQEVLKLGDCRFPPGMCFGLQEIIVDKHGHEVDGDWKLDKNGEWVSRDTECEHPDTPEYKAEHKKVKKHKKAMIEQTSTDSGTDISTATETVATVEVAKPDPVIPKKEPASMDAALTMIIGAVSGMVTPMLMNFIKSLLKNKLKKQNKNETKEEESEEPTDCKTHQIKNNAKMLSITKRLGIIEQQLNTPKEQKEDSLDIDSDEVSGLVERVEKLEKALKIKK